MDRDHYQQCIANGCSPKLAEMLASRTPPMSNTDRELWYGHINGRQFEESPQIGDYYRQQARLAGVDPKGKIYLSGLARYPGDPEAWVESRGDIRRILEKRGWGADGLVKMPVRKDESPPALESGLDPSLVDEYVNDRLAAVPEGEKVDAEAVRHEVVSQLKPHWSN
jgi:hypothetical protein